MTDKRRELAEKFAEKETSISADELADGGHEGGFIEHWECLRDAHLAGQAASDARAKGLVEAGRRAITDAYVEEQHNIGEQCCGMCDLRKALAEYEAGK